MSVTGASSGVLYQREYGSMVDGFPWTRSQLEGTISVAGWELEAEIGLEWLRMAERRVEQSAVLEMEWATGRAEVLSAVEW